MSQPMNMCCCLSTTLIYSMMSCTEFPDRPPSYSSVSHRHLDHEHNIAFSYVSVVAISFLPHLAVKSKCLRIIKLSAESFCGTQKFIKFYFCLSGFESKMNAFRSFVIMLHIVHIVLIPDSVIMAVSFSLSPMR